MKFHLAVFAIAAASSISFPAVAQFSLPSIPGLSKASANTADVGAQQDSLIAGYVAANKDVLTANAKMAEALGLKSESAAALATAEALTSGATKDSINETDKAIGASTSAVSAELAKAPKLDATAKQTFAAGLVSLASGAVRYVGVGKNVKAMTNSLSSVSPLQLPKLQSAVTIVANFPESMASVSTALQNAVAFAKNNDIPVPADATSILSAL